MRGIYLWRKSPPVSTSFPPIFFSRLFSQITGASFINHLTEIRLQGTNDQIKEISETVGYSNIYYFSRVFKNKSG